MNIHLKIRECVDKRGTEVIVTSTLIGMLDDEQVFEDINSVPYKKILRNIIKEGYAQKLLDLGSYTPDVNFLASQYAQANLMQEGHVLYVLDCLAYGLGWMDDEPTLQIGNNQSPPASAQGNAVEEYSPYVKYLDKFQEELNLEKYTVGEIKDAVSPYLESVINGTWRGVSSEIVYIVAILLHENQYLLEEISYADIDFKFVTSVLYALAKDNYAPAMCYLGHRILTFAFNGDFYGEDGFSDFDEDEFDDYALRNYFKKAADMGYVPAFRGMARCYEYSERYDKAIECYQKAISKGYIRAWNDLATLYSLSLHQPDKALDCYEKGAKKGNTDCAYYAALSYMDGRGADRDYEVALDYFEQADLPKEDYRRVDRQVYMGMCYFYKLQEYGVTPTEDSLRCYKDAEQLLLVGALKNNNEAQLLLGQLYLRYGHIHVRNADYNNLHNKAYKWLKQAADEGKRLADEGWECPRSCNEAKKLLWDFREYWPNKPI